MKALSNLFISLGGTKENLGFSNSRLAYDEIISKFCYSIESGTLKKKITSTDISEQYRKGTPFSDECIEIAEDTIQKLLGSICKRDDYKFSFNKATLYSWLIFTRQNLTMDGAQFDETIVYFEYCRAFIKGKFKNINELYSNGYNRLNKKLPFFELMLNMFNQRSSMGSTDALSIIYRDIIIAIFRDALLLDGSGLVTCALNTFSEHENFNSVLEVIVRDYNWGEKF